MSKHVPGVERETAAASTPGIHHITAVSGDPQKTVEFYVGVLGMRLVKKSVNQDSPDTYHLFFADGVGNPGTDLTFFPWPNLPPVRAGAGQWGEIALGVPAGSLGFWLERLSQSRFGAENLAISTEERFGEPTLSFVDPNGMRVALVESESYDGLPFAPWTGSPVAAENQVRSLAGIRITVGDIEPVSRFLSAALGFRETSEHDGFRRFVVGDGAAGQRIDITVDPDAPRGTQGVGTVHHVAWRTRDSDSQLALRERITSAGARPTDVIDRFWFKSIYFTEPSGALLEVATDGPGFSIDEPVETLGEKLILPPRFEPYRDRIEAALPPVSTRGLV
ncbi:MAG: ring-cleaving dioxygenase [Spirochaetaceae bacterium]|nr:MAG: ring-cleaving dioxygenase [Spirochaetaceae bacterium]